MVVALGAGFYFGVYQGQVIEYEKLVKMRDSVQTKFLKNQRIASKLDLYKKEYAKLEEQLQKALGELPLKKEIPSLLTKIGELARNQGLDIMRFQPKGENKKDFYAEVPVELKLTGTYHQAALFFDSIGNMERIVNIKNLKLGDANAEGGETKLSIDCRAITFRFIENAPEKSKKKGG